MTRSPDPSSRYAPWPQGAGGQLGMAGGWGDAWQHELRDGRGRWTATGRASLSEWAADAPRLAAMVHGTGASSYTDKQARKDGDRALAEIFKAQGFDGLPRTGTAADLNRAEAKGGTRIWRGTAGPDAGRHAAQLASGPYRAGFGIYGNGTYFSTASREAEDYALGGEGGGHVTEAVMPASARMGDYDALFDQMWDEVHAPGADPDAARLFDDIGRYAAAKGYDGYTVASAKPPQVVVLNRSALILRGAS